MKLLIKIVLCAVGVWVASSMVLRRVDGEASPERQAEILFGKLANARLEVCDFVSDDPMAQACVHRITLGHSFIQKIEARFGDDAVQDFNFAVQGGEIHILWWPDKIEPERIRVKPVEGGMFLFDYPNLGVWPVSEPEGWRISLSEYLAAKKVDVEEYRVSLAREIFYYEKGLSLIASSPDLTVKKLREEMEKAFKEFK